VRDVSHRLEEQLDEFRHGLPFVGEGEVEIDVRECRLHGPDLNLA
jgi:hypothetical protein